MNLPGLSDDFYLFLVADENKRPATLKTLPRRWRQIQAHGFDIDRFLRDADCATDERRRLIAALKTGSLKATDTAVANYLKVVYMICRWQEAQGRSEYASVRVKLPQRRKREKRAYSDPELKKLDSLPYARTEDRRRQRALVAAHISFGARNSEHVGMNVTDIDFEERTFRILHPAKHSWPRTLPIIEKDFLHPQGPFMAWLRHRPASKTDPDALWLKTRQDGRVTRMSEAEIYKELRAAGKGVGVQTNFNRGRHTRMTSLLRGGYHPLYILEYLGDNDSAMLRIYAETDLQDMKQAAEKLPNRTFPHKRS